jgi:DNA-binding NarL/FixJ family response regulator
VIVAFSGSRELWRAALAAGAARTILKDEDPQTLLVAIRTAAQRKGKHRKRDGVPDG